MQDLEIIEKTLKSTKLTLKSRAFLEDLKKKVVRFGSLVENQRSFLLKIANENGIKAVVKQDQPTKIEIVKGSCGSCEDCLVSARQITTQNLYIFKCNCNVGQKRDEAYPVWIGNIDYLKLC